MKSISPQLATHIAGAVTSLAYLWLVQRTDGVTLGFTDHDIDISYNGVVYAASSGFSSSAVVTTAAMSVDNLEVNGFLTSPSITESSLAAGVWDYAKVTIMCVNFMDLTMGSLEIKTGNLGNVVLHRDQYVAEIRGLSQSFVRTVGRLYTAGCDADLGDARCTKDLTLYTTTGAVTTVINNQVFTTTVGTSTVQITPTLSGNPPAGYFEQGLLTWITGQNAGLKMEIKYSDTLGNITLVLPMSYPVSLGDTFSAHAGCNKVGRSGDCLNKFNNYVFFRGFEDVPGIDALLAVGGQTGL